jgi:hypothetical protein
MLPFANYLKRRGAKDAKAQRGREKILAPLRFKYMANDDDLTEHPAID